MCFCVSRFLCFSPFGSCSFAVQLAALVVAMAVALVVSLCVVTKEMLWEGEECAGGGKCVNVAA